MVGVMILARSLIGVFLCFGVSLPALADTVCTNLHSDGELYQCTVQKKKLAEEVLNQEYAIAKKRIVKMYGAAQQQANEYISNVVETQRSWLKYRNGQCDLEASAAEKGSSVHEVASDLCIIRMDKERTSMLKQLPY